MSLNGSFQFTDVDPKHLQNLVLVLTPRPLHLHRADLSARCLKKTTSTLTGENSLGWAQPQLSLMRSRSESTTEYPDVRLLGRHIYRAAATSRGHAEQSLSPGLPHLDACAERKRRARAGGRRIVSARKFVRACADVHDSEAEPLDAGIHRAHESVLDAVTLNFDSCSIHTDRTALYAPTSFAPLSGLPPASPAFRRNRSRRVRSGRTGSAIMLQGILLLGRGKAI
ncbi:hypothetical protein OH77DRAFT_153609 [Trametes cingulata]|nr:hypothetical protein OH77DRAFT_153609 [Trametes cingulata]